MMSTPFRPKIEQNCIKTPLNGVGRASRGIGQLIAPSSSNISPWGPMADPFKPMFIDFQIFLKIEIDISETLFENMNFSWLLWPNRSVENDRISILYM